MLAATACDVLVFNSTTAKHRSLSLVERINLHEEGCNIDGNSNERFHQPSITSSFGPAVRSTEVAFLTVAAPNTVVVYDSRLSQPVESSFSITSLRLPVYVCDEPGISYLCCVC